MNSSTTTDRNVPATAGTSSAATPLAAHRLRKHADYQLVYKAGRKQFGEQMGYFHALRPPDRRSETPGARVGLTVPKALGKAVDRNRIKRRMREAVRAALPLLTSPVDVVLHPRRTVMDLDFVQLKREVATIFRSIQAACERGPAAGHAANSAGRSGQTSRTIGCAAVVGGTLKA
jgi:ribonuclease P protein component